MHWFVHLFGSNVSWPYISQNNVSTGYRRKQETTLCNSFEINYSTMGIMRIISAIALQTVNNMTNNEWHITSSCTCASPTRTYASPNSLNTITYSQINVCKNKACLLIIDCESDAFFVVCIFVSKIQNSNYCLP